MNANCRWLYAAVAALTVSLLVPTARAESTHETLMAAHADSVISVKYVLAVQFSFRGQTMDQEMSGTTVGIVVDSAGLIMVPSSALSPHSGGRRGMSMSSTPTSIRIIFPGDPKEYEAVLGATDSRLGLSFLRIKDLEGKEISALDTANGVKPAIGDRLYGVSRLAEGFDHAPYCDAVDVVAHVTKPRKMWLVRGGFSVTAHPLFTADGALAGFSIYQEGVGGGGRLRFALPVKVAVSTIERAGREAQRVLEEALEREAEEAAKEADDTEQDAENGDEEEPDEGEGEPAGEPASQKPASEPDGDNDK